MNPDPPILLHLLAPAWSERETGGNVYNRALWSALRELGVAATCGSAEELVLAPPVLLVDSLYLERLPELRRRLPHSILLLLAHYLPSAVRLGRAPDRDELSELERRALGCIDGAVATSSTMARCLEGLAPLAWNLVLPPGSSGATSQQSPPAYPLEALLVANLVPGKGVLELLRELARQGRPDDRYTLTIVGDETADPAHSDALRAASRSLSGRIRFAGPLAHAELLRFYADHHLLVSASHMESYGMALAEAGEAGVPRVALNRGHTCALFPSSNTEGLVDGHAELAQLFLETARHPSKLEQLREAQQLPSPPLPSWKERALELWSSIYDRWGRQE